MCKTGHERCHTCPECSLGWCPDCDDEGRVCLCEGWGNEMTRAANASVDIPLHRPKPRRRRDGGASTVEYALLAVMLSALLIAAIGLRGQIDFSIPDLTQEVQQP